MKKFIFILLPFVLFQLPIDSVTAQPGEPTFYSGRLWVQLDPAQTKSIVSVKKQVDLSTFLKTIELSAPEYEITLVKKPFYFARTTAISEVYTIYFNAHGKEDELARILGQLPAVQYAERVPIIRPTLIPNDLGAASGSSNQWGLWKINAPEAWDISTGSTDITVAIVDDAILTTHPDLIPNLVQGYDVADDDTDPMPNEVAMSHGTHVAGIVGAASNNGIGVASIGYGLKIMPVKSSNVPQTISDAYSGVIWAADNGADVINMSWGSDGFSITGQNIIDYAYEAGCVNVAATGNDDLSTVFYPAGYNNVLSVSSTTSSDTKSDFSNYGNWVDVSAPGSQILSTYIGNDFAPVYAYNSGTSMASPMVAGLAGLVLSVNPNLPQEQVMDCITSTATDITAINPNYIGQLGSGRIDALQAILCAQATVNAPPVAVINAENTVICPGGLVHFSAISAGGFAENYTWTFPGGNPAASTDPNPIVAYSEVGVYDVTLTLNNAFGSDEVTISGMIEVSENGTDLIFSEDFEEITIESAGWETENPDGGISWDIFSVSGTEIGSKAAGINLFSYNATGQRDGLISPVLNFSNNENITLSFDHAHRRFSSNFSDSLIVYISTDGGATYPHRVLQVAENGSGTFATGALLNENFVPAGSGDWCFMGDIGTSCFDIDLTAFEGQSEVRIKFETYNDFGNNIYIDNVQVSGNCILTEAPPVAGFSASDEAICTGESIQFFDQSINIPLIFEWTFEGGNPATSGLAAPVVTYAVPGTYSVSLQVTNLLGTDITVLEDFITVSEAPELEISADEITVCSGQSAILTASGALEYLWSPDIALSSTTGAEVEASPTAPITYTVTAITNGCSTEETVDVNVLPSPVDPQVISENDVAFTVLTPPAASGYYDYSSTSVNTGWGNEVISAVSVEAQLVIARDGTAADSLLCNDAVNTAELAGNIAVIYRGGCEFGSKAFNAQVAGASAVIVINNESGAPIEMGAGAEGNLVSIPVIMVSDVTGETINEAIHAGETTAVLGQFNGGNLWICPGETLRLAAPGGWNDYLWTNGENAAVTNISEPGEFSVEIFAENNCSSSSDVFTVEMYDVIQPVIESSEFGGLVVNNISTGDFTWFFEGEPVPNQSGIALDSVSAGTYVVQVTDANGCISTSDPFEVVVLNAALLSVENLNIFPVPAAEMVTINWGHNAITGLQVFSASGKEVFNADHFPATQSKIMVNTSSWASGVYVVKVSGKDGSQYGRMIITH